MPAFPVPTRRLQIFKARILQLQQDQGTLRRLFLSSVPNTLSNTTRAEAKSPSALQGLDNCQLLFITVLKAHLMHALSAASP
jgi:hypothetical protein